MKKRFTDEQVIAILREAEAGAASIKALCKMHNISEQTFFRWRNRFGGMDVPDARRLIDSGDFLTVLALEMVWVDEVEGRRPRRMVPVRRTSSALPEDRSLQTR